MLAAYCVQIHKSEGEQIKIRKNRQRCAVISICIIPSKQHIVSYALCAKSQSTIE